MGKIRLKVKKPGVAPYADQKFASFDLRNGTAMDFIIMTTYKKSEIRPRLTHDELSDLAGLRMYKRRYGATNG